MVGGLNAVEFLLVNAPGGYFFWTKKPSLSTECWDIWPRVTREQSRLFALALVARRGGDLDNLLVVEGEVFSKFPENSACFGSFWPKGERFRLSLGPSSKYLDRVDFGLKIPGQSPLGRLRLENPSIFRPQNIPARVDAWDISRVSDRATVRGATLQWSG